MKKKTKSGYVKIHAPNHKYSHTRDNWILEHRTTVETFLKRPLNPTEIVHHLNEKKDDNRIDNLMLFKSNKEHMKWHTQLKMVGLTNSMRRKIKNRWETTQG